LPIKQKGRFIELKSFYRESLNPSGKSKEEKKRGKGHYIKISTTTRLGKRFLRGSKEIASLSRRYWQEKEVEETAVVLHERGKESKKSRAARDRPFHPRTWGQKTGSYSDWRKGIYVANGI